MHSYKDIITLNQNKRGCYILDTVKGCSCVTSKPGGCYGDCYANHIADRYGFDFSNPVNRDFMRKQDQIYFNGFMDTSHEAKIIKQIRAANMPFIRVGEMGDPSEDWEHTLSVCKSISVANKPIVIITKHWKTMTEKQINEFLSLNVYFNTSVSALDSPEELSYRIKQHERILHHAVIRVVTCSFVDKERANIQDWLLNRWPVIDTVFRPSVNNPFLVNGIIKARKVKFLGTTMLASLHKDDVFLGYCKDCPEQCGINMFKE